MLRKFESCKNLPKGAKKVESSQPRPYCLIWGSVRLWRAWRSLPVAPSSRSAACSGIIFQDMCSLFTSWLLWCPLVWRTEWFLINCLDGKKCCCWQDHFTYELCLDTYWPFTFSVSLPVTRSYTSGSVFSLHRRVIFFFPFLFIKANFFKKIKTSKTLVFYVFIIGKEEVNSSWILGLKLGAI